MTFPSPRSASATRKKPDLLKRHPRARRVQDSDLATFWAAYSLGAWADLLPEGLGPASFRPAIETLIGSCDHEWVLESNRSIVGLALARELCAGRAIEVQVDWFQWASTRHKMEAAAGFFREATKHFQVFVFSAEDSKRFWLRLCRYRLLRNGCTVVNHFGPGEHGYFFYTAA